MLAVVGVITQEVFRWNSNFPSKNPLEAITTAPTLGIVQIIVACGALEIATAKYQSGRVPGDYGFDPFKVRLLARTKEQTQFIFCTLSFLRAALRRSGL
jgi:hypothetical protein